MRRVAPTAAALFALVALPSLLLAQDEAKQKVKSAMSAAPTSVAENATVMDWDQTVLRQGTNGWTCLPDIPDSPGNDPMCLDEPWVNWVHAWLTKTEPSFNRIGFGYMLVGSSPESNIDPYAEGPTADNEWMTESTPHIMMIVPDPSVLKGLTSDPKNGGPWVMWRGTPYVHVMIPTPKKGEH